MATLGWNGIAGRIGIPDTVNGVNSRAFAIPPGCKVMTIHVPDLVGVATTVKLQSLEPPLTDAATEVWRDANVFDLTTGNVTLLDAIPESAMTTLPISATGSGVLRFVASAAQTGAVDQFFIVVFFGQDG